MTAAYCRQKLIGADPMTDLAVIKVSGSGFPQPSLGRLHGRSSQDRTVLALAIRLISALP